MVGKKRHSKKLIGKKGFFFSFISILIVIIFGIIISGLVSSLSIKDTSSVLNRVESFSSYYELIKTSYIKSSIDISTRAVLNSMTTYVTSIQKPIPQDKLKFVYRSLYENGNFYFIYDSYEYNCSSLCENIMTNKTLSYLLSLLENSSNDVIFHSKNYTLDVNFNSINLKQSSPWEVDFEGYFKILLNSTDFYIFDENLFVETSVSIINLNDPLYGYNSGDFSKKIFQNDNLNSNFKNNWNLKILNETLINQQFFQTDRGLSFLMRLMNVTEDSSSKDISRIASFISPELISKNLTSPLFQFNDSRKSRSFLDYSFFKNDFYSCKDQNLPENFLYKLVNVSANETYIDFRLSLNQSITLLGDSFNKNSLEVVCGNGFIS